MVKNSRYILKEEARLGKENAALRLQLGEAKKYIDTIKTASIDAVVITDKKDLKVYTEKTSDKIYRLLIEKMNEGAVTLNEDGTILYCNSSFAKMVNLPLQKVPGTKFKKFIDDSSKGRFETLLQHGRKNDAQEEVNIHTHDGKTVAVLMSVTALPLENNFVLSIILTDLTIYNIGQEELKRITGQLHQKNTELESANEDLTSFTHISSHDLQEPLRKIQTFAGLLSEKENKNLSDTGKHYLNRMQEIAKRMQALIEDLLTYSRTKTTEHNFNKTDLTKIIDEVKAEFEEVIREKKATIEATRLCETRIIRFQFRQLMQNLISNSLKFSSPEKKIHIIIKSKIVKGNKLKNEKPALPAGRLSQETDYCHIIYTDNGIGFDPQYKDRIFEVFQRLHSKEAYPGSGMGLAICKRIVENHNGIITATGKLNKGARFDIYIPAS